MLQAQHNTETQCHIGSIMRQDSTWQGFKIGAWNLIWYLSRQMIVSYTVWRFLLRRTIMEHKGCVDKEFISHHLLMLLIKNTYTWVMEWTNSQQAILNTWYACRLLIIYTHSQERRTENTMEGHTGITLGNRETGREHERQPWRGEDMIFLFESFFGLMEHWTPLLGSKQKLCLISLIRLFDVGFYWWEHDGEVNM